MSDQDFERMSEDEFALRYRQLSYALDFDAGRSNADDKNKVYFPL